jgi:hypothetical protein
MKVSPAVLEFFLVYVQTDGLSELKTCSTELQTCLEYNLHYIACPSIVISSTHTDIL